MTDFSGYTPRRGLVLIECAQPVEQSRGGLLYSESAAPRLPFGVVRAIGPGELTTVGSPKPKPSDFEIGDSVVFSPYSGTVMDGERGERCCIIKQDAVLAVMV